METRNQHNASPFSSTGEPRPRDVPITVLTALILLFVLVVVALL